MNFKNKVCVITGGANGIGYCLAKEFAKAGAKIAFIDIDKDSGDKLQMELINSGHDALFFYGDISEESTLQNFANEVIKRFGGVDYLINNACLSKRGIISGCSFDDFNYVLRVGVTAPYMLTRLFLDKFNENAAIVNISSTRAFMSQPDTESYTAAKGAITALTHALAVSLAGKVRVNSISPGWIDVSSNYDSNNEEKQSREDKLQHPSHRIGRPIDIARVVMFLCHEENGFINGENIIVDGGMTKLMIYHNDYGWKYNLD